MSGMYFNRRMFLKGAGVTMALPMLESAVPYHSGKKKLIKPVKRFVCLSNNYGVYQKAFFPEVSDVGTDYEMPETLTSLEKHRKEITLFKTLIMDLPAGMRGCPFF